MQPKKKLRHRLLLSAIILLLIYLGFLGEFNFYNLFTLSREARSLSNEITREEQQREELAGEIDKLKNDATYIEQVAREEFKMGKKGEKIFLIRDKESQ